MKQSTTVLTRKKRGPAPTGKGTLIGVRLQPQMLAALDEAAAALQETSRPEVVRRLLREWLKENGYLPK
ncbi:ribbon-helix-helix protein, CopG family [Mesorhizobium sp. 43Arga]